MIDHQTLCAHPKFDGRRGHICGGLILFLTVFAWHAVADDGTFKLLFVLKACKNGAQCDFYSK